MAKIIFAEQILQEKPRGGLEAKSPEAKAAIARIGLKLNPGWGPAVATVDQPKGEKYCLDCGCDVHKAGVRCRRCTAVLNARRRKYAGLR